MHRSTALLTLVPFLLAACGDGDDESTPTPESSALTAPSTPQELIDRLNAALDREGQVFHTIVTLTTTAGEAFPDDTGTTRGIRTDEIWVNASESTARRFIRKDPEYEGELDDEAVAIAIEGLLYDRLSGTEIDTIDPPAEGCPQIETLQTALILIYDFCRSHAALADEAARFEARLDADAEFEGTPAVALVYDVQVQPEGQPSPTPLSPQPPSPVPNIHTQTLVSRFYVDRETLLPLAWTIESWDHEGRQAGITEARFENDFIPHDDLAAGFFHPVTLLDPAPDVPVYWLGNSFGPDGELPLIVPRGLNGSPSGLPLPTYQANLSYSAPFGSDQWLTEIHIQQWALDDWEAALGAGSVASELWLYPCATAQPFDVEGGEATIYLTYEPEPEGPLPGEDDACPKYEHDRFIGVVQFDETILLINGPFGNELHPRNLGDGYDPYNSLEGIQTIIEGLHPWTSKDTPAAASGGTPSIEEVYSGLASTLQRDSMVLHSTRAIGSEITGFLTGSGTIELWVDGPAAVARGEVTGSSESVEQGQRQNGTTWLIVRGGSTYFNSEGTGQGDDPRTVDSPGCYGQPEAIATVIGCPGPTETSTTTVEWGDLDGEPAIVLVPEGSWRGADEVSEFTQRTYLDPETFLPTFSEQEGTYNNGSEYPQWGTASYEHEFIERSSLSASFFDLSAIGYPEPEQR